jgi:hypothetical protein
MPAARNTLRALAVLTTVVALTSCENGSEPTTRPAPATATPSTTPTATAGQPQSLEGVNGPIEAGSWIVPFWGRGYKSLPRAVVEVPAGYGSPGGWVVDRGADGDPEEYGDVSFWTVAGVVRDPCEGVATDDPGPSVRDLAVALRAQPGHRTTKPRAVDVDGHSGLYLEVTLPDQEQLNGCHESEQMLWRTDAGAGYGSGIGDTVSRLWILDVDGTRVVMVAGTTPNETADEVAEVVAIAASAHFIDPL